MATEILEGALTDVPARTVDEVERPAGGGGPGTFLGQRRTISFWGAFSIVAGSMLGVGIFLSPVEMARNLATPGLFLGVWALAGIVVIGGAVAYAELGVRFPRAGGDYVFHREVFGASVAFATGWGLFGAIFCGSIAAVAVAIFQYQVSAVLGVDLTQPVPGLEVVSFAQLLGCLLVLGLTRLNARGVSLSAAAQQLATLTPMLVLLMVAIVTLGLWAGGRVPPHAVAAAPPDLTTGGLVAAWLAAYFAYSGWNAIIYVGGEVERPGRNIPRALLGGSISVIALYILLCVAFIAGLGMAGLAQAGEAGSALASALGGPAAKALMNFLVLLCLISTLNSSVLGGGRVAFAMAHDGAFWRRAGRLHPQTHVPAFALWLQAAVSIGLILTNRFDDLLKAVSLAMVLTGSLTVLALFVIRHRERRAGVRAPAGYRAAAWPWLPGLYLVSSVLVMGGMIWSVATGESRANPLVGLAALVLIWVGHVAVRRWKATR